MADILNSDDKVIHTSRNLRGLYDHARRVAYRLSEPLFMSVSRVIVVKSPQGARLSVEYSNGDTGTANFADYSIACDWGKRFAEKRGGEFRS